MVLSEQIAAAQAICAQQPVAAVVPAEKLNIAAKRGWQAAGGELWSWPTTTAPLAIAWAGVNLIPVVPGQLAPSEQHQAIAYFAQKAKQWGQRCSSITGLAEPVQQLWQVLRLGWPDPHEVRYRQPLFVLDTPISPLAYSVPDEVLGRIKLGITRPDQLELLWPASIAMFTEEVGYSPLRFGQGAYQAHLKALIASRRSYCGIDNGRVIFKADIGAAAGGVAQLQGVWIAPDYRGQGLAKAALQQVISDIQTRVAPNVSLYVNLHNSRAIHLYQSLGFRQIGQFATVLF